MIITNEFIETVIEKNRPKGTNQQLFFGTVALGDNMQRLFCFLET